MRFQVSRGAVTALFLTFVVASCGGRTDPTELSMKAGDFPAGVARAFCENIGGCCEKAGRFFDSTGCPALLEPELEALFPVPADAAEKRIPARCLNDVASTIGQCRGWSPCPEFVIATKTHGMRGEGCDTTSFPFEGTIAVGGSSGRGDKSCFVSDGLFCSNKTGNCEPRAAVGQPCDPSEFSCANSECRDGLCLAPLAPGADCSNRPGGCAEGLVCEAGDQLCTLPVAFQGVKCTCNRLRPNGAACNASRQCASAPCTDGRCQESGISDAELARLCTG